MKCSLREVPRHHLSYHKDKNSHELIFQPTCLRISSLARRINFHVGLGFESDRALQISEEGKYLAFRTVAHKEFRLD